MRISGFRVSDYSPNLELAGHVPLDALAPWIRNLGQAPGAFLAGIPGLYIGVPCAGRGGPFRRAIQIAMTTGAVRDGDYANRVVAKYQDQGQTLAGLLACQERLCGDPI